MIKLCNIGKSTQCLVQHRHSFKISSYVHPLMAHWLRFCTAHAGGMGSIPDWGTKISHAPW